MRVLQRAVAVALAAWVLALSGAALAQLELLVNGVRVAGATTAWVPETTYAPGEDLAAALGATLWIDRASGRATLTLGAAVVTMALVESANLALAPQPALLRDGEPRPGPAALWLDARLWLPVKAVGEALGGRVSFLGETQSVALVLPRPRISATLTGEGRLELALDAPGAIRSTFDAERSQATLFFERADGEVDPSLGGEAFTLRAQQRVAGGRELVLDVREGFAPRLYLVPDGAGARLWVDFEPDAAAGSRAPTGALVATRWLLDAGPAGPPGAGLLEALSEPAQAFVEWAALALNRAGVEAQSSRAGLAPVAFEERFAMTLAADVVVAVHAAELPQGTIRIYVLGEANDLAVLERAVRSNASLALSDASTDALRRQLLLRLVPDAALGQSWGLAFAGAARAAGWQSEGPIEAPLALLAGAGGRGLLLELSAEDLRDPRVAQGVADLLLRTLPSLSGR